MFNKYSFPKGFIWGTGTSSYQIEGGYQSDGKGESIWDRFTHIPGKISDGTHGDLACDHYNLFEEDVKILKELGVKSYRFSISWPRIFPEGKGKVNAKGIEFYKRLVDSLLENGIEPAVTLYHWDLPQKLQDIGGWANREIVEYYEEYAGVVFDALGEKVKLWVTHNEPGVAAFAGYASGNHAPGIKDVSTAFLAAHHMLLSHGKAVRAFRKRNMMGEIGITLSMQMLYPASENPQDIEVTERFHAVTSRLYADPVLKGKYPMDELYEVLKRNRVIFPEFTQEDMEIISEPVDFLGLNYYTSAKCKADPAEWPYELKCIPIDADKTDIGWSIHPKGLYDLLKRLHKDYDGVRIIITENGAACNDRVHFNGKVEDTDRIDYLYTHIKQAHKALQEGVNLGGYYVWSLMDNFEWEFGYSKRFGIVYVDYISQKRIIKESGLWYKNLIESSGV